MGLLALVIPQVLASGYGWAQKAGDTRHADVDPTVDRPATPAGQDRRDVALDRHRGLRAASSDPASSSAPSSVRRSGAWATISARPVADSPAVFVVVGMMACFGSVAHAPLAVMIMVAEMTGSFSVIPCAMVAVGIAYLVISRTQVSIYRAQRLNRETAAAERVTTHPAPEIVVLDDNEAPDRKLQLPRTKGSRLSNRPSPHATSLIDGEIVEESDLGSIRRVTADNLPILPGCRSNAS